MCNIRRFDRLFHRTPSLGGRGRRAAVDFVVCLGFDGISWCVWGSVGYRGVFGVRWHFVFSMSLHVFSNSCTRLLAARDPEQSASTR